MKIVLDTLTILVVTVAILMLKNSQKLAIHFHLCG